MCSMKFPHIHYIAVLVSAFILGYPSPGSATLPNLPPVECNNEGWYFKEHPLSTEVAEGHRVYLECHVNPEKDCNLIFSWELDGKSIENTTRRYQSGRSLVIERVSRKYDSGHFTCVGRDVERMVPQASNAATLSIIWLDETVSVKVEGQDPNLAPSDNLTLVCHFEGSKDSTIDWFKNGKPYPVSQAYATGRVRALNQAHDSIRIEPLNAVEDNGVYSCSVTNSMASVRSDSNYALRLPVPNGPRLVSISRDKTAKRGDPITLDCQYENALTAVWKRARDDKVFKSSTERIRVLPSGSLSIPSVEKTDEGWYICSATGKGENGLQYGVYIQIAYLEDFYTPPAGLLPPRSSEVYVGGQGKTFDILCSPPVGFPRPTVRWMKNRGEHITPLTGKAKQTGDDRLVIESAKKRDESEYTCVVENLAGSQHVSFSLKISTPPKIGRHPASKIAEEGAMVNLTCSFKGDPDPISEVAWEKDGYILKPHRNFVSLAYSNMESTLTLISVTMKHQGDYVCVVLTEGQTPVRSNVARVTVREKLKFKIQPKDEYCIYNTPCSLNCSATAFQKPRLEWLKIADLDKDGRRKTLKQMIPMKMFGRPRVSENGSLHFGDKVRWGDEGVYMCVAMSDTQGFLNATAKVVVYIPPTFIIQPANQTAMLGSDAYFHCQAEGTPKPAMEWDRPGASLTNLIKSHPYKYKIFPNNTLLIRNVTYNETGRYGCMIGNKGEISRTEVYLCVKDKAKGLLYCGKPLGYVNVSYSMMPPPTPYPPDTADSNLTVTVLIGCSVAAAYILLVIIVLFFMFRRHKQSTATDMVKLDESHLTQNGSAITNGAANGHALPVDPAGVTTPLNSSLMAGNSVVQASHTTASKPSTNSMEELTFPRENLKFVSKFGSGVYGEVHLMRAAGIRPNELESFVVVKLLQTTDQELHAQMSEEIDMYSKLNHPHIAALLGICNDGLPVYILSEYLEYGNLKHYMMASRNYDSQGNESVGSNPPPLVEPQIVSIAYQVASGLEYLAANRYVHRDIAARNVLVSSTLHAKITNLSLSADAFLEEYYTYRHLVHPLRWMSGEALFDDEWSTKSDVWAWAVFVWELYAVGELPYSQLTNEQVIEELKRGMLELNPPPACEPLVDPVTGVSFWSARRDAGGTVQTTYVNPVLAEVMQECRSLSPRDRPTFDVIVERISQLQADTHV